MDCWRVRGCRASRACGRWPPLEAGAPADEHPTHSPPIGDLLERQGELRAALTALEAALSGLDRRVVSGAESTAQELARSIHFQGLIRYNAYRDMGGQQSWSIALLNAAQTGTVITCLHARDHARVYLKEIVTGSSEQRLSPEEMRAIHTAMAS